MFPKSIPRGSICDGKDLNYNKTRTWEKVKRGKGAQKKCPASAKNTLNGKGGFLGKKDKTGENQSTCKSTQRRGDFDAD